MLGVSATLGICLGCEWAKRRIIQKAQLLNGTSSFDLMRLESRIQFAQNPRMRLQEMSHQHATLTIETDVLEALRRIKRGASTMLELLATELQPPHPITTEEEENLEGLSGASGKALRLTLDLGRVLNSQRKTGGPRFNPSKKHWRIYCPKERL